MSTRAERIERMVQLVAAELSHDEAALVQRVARDQHDRFVDCMRPYVGRSMTPLELAALSLRIARYIDGADPS